MIAHATPTNDECPDCRRNALKIQCLESEVRLLREMLVASEAIRDNWSLLCTTTIQENKILHNTNQELMRGPS